MKLPIRSSNWKSLPKDSAFSLCAPSCHPLLKIPSATYEMGMLQKVRSSSLNYILLNGTESEKTKAPTWPSVGILIRDQKANANLRFFQKLKRNCLPRIPVAVKTGQWLGYTDEETPIWHKSVCIKILLYMRQKHIQTGFVTNGKKNVLFACHVNVFFFPAANYAISRK